MISPEQSRAARGWLDWSQDELARRADLSLSTVRDFEKGRHTPTKKNLEVLRLALVSEGIQFLIEESGVAIGVKTISTSSGSPMISPEQSRAAGGWLDWSQEELARRAKLSPRMVGYFEKGRHTPMKKRLEALRLAFVAEGLGLLFAESGDATGIEVKPKRPEALAP